MNAEESFINKRDLFIKECIKNKFSDRQAEKFHNSCLEYIRRLKEVRLSEHLTNEIIDELITKTDNWIWSDENKNFIANEYSFIINQLFNAIINDKTYWYSILRLGQYYNCKTRLNPIDLGNKYLTQIELEELIYKESPKPIFRVKDDEEINNIFEVISGEIFNCTAEQFIASIEAAFFDPSTIKSYNQAKEIVYRLKTIMKDEWYTATCKNMGWEKTDVSGRNVSFKPSLEKLLPRPNKKTK